MLKTFFCNVPNSRQLTNVIKANETSHMLTVAFFSIISYQVRAKIFFITFVACMNQNWIFLFICFRNAADFTSAANLFKSWLIHFNYYSSLFLKFSMSYDAFLSKPSFLWLLNYVWENVTVIKAFDCLIFGEFSTKTNIWNPKKLDFSIFYLGCQQTIMNFL